MAQRKSPPPGKSSTGRASSTGKVNTSKAPAGGKTPAGTKGASGGRGPATKPPPRKGKSIVNQKQTPWGLIISTIAVVAFAAAVVIVVVVTHKSSSGSTSTTTGGQKVDASDPWRQPEAPAAAKIKGVTYRVEGSHNHVDGVIKYDTTPPIGGNHNGFWADCTGTVYAQPIANENAVHMLEHGAVWITYNAKSLPAAQLTTLKSYVAGVDRMALSPYPNLKTNISLQAWGYQLFVSNASDPRIAEFIAALKFNPKTTPESNATCSNPGFKSKPSTFGHPTSG